MKHSMISRGFTTTVSLCLLILTLVLPGTAHAQTNCSGTLSGTYADINVNGGACVLDGATVTGSVSVTGGGTLEAKGDTQINGSISVEGGGDVVLRKVTVLGDVALKDAANLSIKSAANLGTVKAENSGAIAVNGTVGDIESKQSGQLKLCGANVTGGIGFIESTGQFVANATCGAASTIGNGILVEKGIGNVRLIGATLADGGLNVVEQTGNVRVENSSLSDVSVEKTTGTVTLDAATADDVKLIELTGAVKIKDSTLTSDVEIKGNGAGVTINNSSFALEDVSRLK